MPPVPQAALNAHQELAAKEVEAKKTRAHYTAEVMDVGIINEDEDDEDAPLPSAAEVAAQPQEPEGVADIDESEVVEVPLAVLLDISAHVPVEPPPLELPPEPVKKMLKKDVVALQKAKAKDEAKAEKEKKQPKVGAFFFLQRELDERVERQRDADQEPKGGYK